MKKSSGPRKRQNNAFSPDRPVARRPIKCTCFRAQKCVRHSARLFKVYHSQASNKQDRAPTCELHFSETPGATAEARGATVRENVGARARLGRTPFVGRGKDKYNFRFRADFVYSAAPAFRFWIAINVKTSWGEIMTSLSFALILRNSRSFCGSRSLTKLLAIPARSGMSSAYFSVSSACSERENRRGRKESQHGVIRSREGGWAPVAPRLLHSRPRSS